MNSVNLLLLLAFIVLLVASVLVFVKPDGGKIRELVIVGITLWCAAQLFAPILVLR